MITSRSLTHQSRSWIARAGFAALLAPVVLATASPAAARSASAGYHEVTVRYGDLDLTHFESAEVLYRRLNKAVRSVCGASEVYERRDLRRMHIQQECYERVLSATVQKVDHPDLAALHRARWQANRTA